jgi:mannose-6-phosphate isomerase-like protein (cupin superfamily)
VFGPDVTQGQKDCTAPASRQAFTTAPSARRCVLAYDIRIDAKHGALELIDAGRLADECTERWWIQTLSSVNDCEVRLGVFEAELHLHHYDREDELFFVLEGKLRLDLEGRKVELLPRQGRIVPRGVEQRTRALARTVVLMSEAGTVERTGDRPEGLGDRERDVILYQRIRC